MVDYRQPPLGYLVRVPQESLDSPLDASARIRAEEAARWLSFEKIDRVFSAPAVSEQETAAIIYLECIPSCLGRIEIDERLDSFPDDIVWRLRPLGDAAPCVIVCCSEAIQAAVARMTGADVCGEIVAPGGIVSIHRQEEKIVAVARTMVLDSKFADFVEVVTSADSVPSVVENAGS